MHDPLPSLHDLSHRKRRTLRLHLRWLIPILVVVGILLWGYLPMPTGPALGTNLNGNAIRSSTRPTLRVATFNIHSGRNAAGQFNLDKTAAVLKGFDLIALNEVRGKPMFQNMDQAQVLGEKLNMQWLFAPTDSARGLAGRPRRSRRPGDRAPPPGRPAGDIRPAAGVCPRRDFRSNRPRAVEAVV